MKLTKLRLVAPLLGMLFCYSLNYGASRAEELGIDPKAEGLGSSNPENAPVAKEEVEATDEYEYRLLDWIMTAVSRDPPPKAHDNSKNPESCLPPYCNPNPPMNPSPPPPPPPPPPQ